MTRLSPADAFTTEFFFIKPFFHAYEDLLVVRRRYEPDESDRNALPELQPAAIRVPPTGVVVEHGPRPVEPQEMLSALHDRR
jgi:hypothetical protein